MLDARRLLPLALGLAITHCGAGNPQPDSAHRSHQRTAPEPPKARNTMTTMGEIGALDEEAVEATFDNAAGELFACYRQGLGRVAYLGGYSLFEVQIDPAGRATALFPKESTLGDRETESCMIEALSGQLWPKPVGGRKGIAARRFDFDPSGSVRPPEPWDQAQVTAALHAQAEALDACRQASASPGLIATLYVQDDGTGEAGHALAAGIASQSTPDGAALDCLVEVLMGAEYPTPGSWVAKVTFEL